MYQQQELERILELSHAMLNLAKSDAWDDLIILEEERRGLISRFFSEPVSPEQAGDVEDTIKTILMLDEQIKELGAVKRFDLLQSLQGLEQGKKAVKAYTTR